LLADCLHALDALGPAGLPALLAGLFLAGLVGGAAHCAGMCGPFVLLQAAAAPGLGGGRLARLSGALLLPYHAGRMLGYAGLGALAGGSTALAGLLARAPWLPALLLGGAALAMAAEAARRWGLSWGVPWAGPWRFAHPRPAGPRPAGCAAPPGWLSRRVAPLLAHPTGPRTLLLGLLLSALPCGLLWAALAAAAASGSALAGGLAMAAFVLGTMPALVGVALLGGLFRRRAAGATARFAPALFAANALLLGALALRLGLQ
jgi:sulfite exporter TauE/SafE